MIYWQLILVYLKIGMFGFGGGYAMLSLIQYEVVDHHHWLTLQQFTDVVAISQMTPGPIGINSAPMWAMQLLKACGELSWPPLQYAFPRSSWYCSSLTSS